MSTKEQSEIIPFTEEFKHEDQSTVIRFSGNHFPAVPTLLSETYVQSQETTEYVYSVPDSSHQAYIGYTLIIECHVELDIPSKNVAIAVPKCQLLDDIGYLLGDKRFSDVTIIVSQQKFFAHKVILAKRSRVFSAMFEHEMAENLDNLVTITDMEPEVCGEMLRYIYTGQAPNIETMADKLLITAEKYELERLKIMCSEAMRTNLTINNAAETLILADLHNATLLKTRTVEFISINLAAVLETNGYHIIKTRLDLVTEVLEAVAMRQKSKTEEAMFCKHKI